MSHKKFTEMKRKTMSKKKIELDSHKAWKFYELTRDTLNNLAKSHGVEEKDLEKYYETTDFYYNKNYADKDWKYAKLINFLGNSISSVFLQMAAHATNTPRMANIIKFEQNLEFLKEKLCDFNPVEFHEKYPDYKDENCIMEVVDALRYNNTTKTGIKWNTDKSQNKDTMMKRFSKILIKSAEYLSHFSNREDVIIDLLNNYKDSNLRALIEYFMKETSYGKTLACDCLKELDKRFSFICKPDIHIMDTLDALYGKIAKNIYDYIEEMQYLVEQINTVNSKEQITIYQLDKMIWLVCSGNFYLDKLKNAKKIYIDKIQNGTYYA